MIRTSECCERCLDECVQLHGLSENEQYYTRVTAAINIIWPIQKTRGHKVKLSFEQFVRYPRHMSNGYSYPWFSQKYHCFLFNTPVLATSRSDNSQPSTRLSVAEITFQALTSGVRTQAESWSSWGNTSVIIPLIRRPLSGQSVRIVTS